MNLSELQSEMSLLEVQISRHATKGETLDADQKLINKLDKLSEACRKPSEKGLHHNIIPEFEEHRKEIIPLAEELEDAVKER